jgi:hypothetical protein
MPGWTGRWFEWPGSPSTPDELILARAVLVSMHAPFYLNRYSHHVVTCALIGLSWLGGCVRVGVLVLFIHDSSDIFPDLLKMSNYMGFDVENTKIPVTEVLFVCNLVAWFVYVHWPLLTTWFAPTRPIVRLGGRVGVSGRRACALPPPAPYALGASNVACTTLAPWSSVGNTLVN